MENKNILILSPHTDDGEIGCGGTINKLIRNKYIIYYAVFSFAKKSIPKGYPSDITKKEVREATKTLGIENLIEYSFPVRDFPKHRQTILETMVQLREEVNPDTVFLPCSEDIHQDHKVIYKEGIRAFRNNSTILGYENIWNNLNFRGNFYTKLSKEDINNKIRAIKCYKSQKSKGKNTPMDLFMLTKLRGRQIEYKFAECFETIRYIWEL